MFKPNIDCLIHRASGKTDVYGMPQPGTLVKERCSIISLNVTSEKSAVRADTSASRGNAYELETVAKLLMTKSTVATIDDMIEIVGVKLRVKGVCPRHSLQGVLDHYEINCSFWSAS